MGFAFKRPLMQFGIDTWYYVVPNLFKLKSKNTLSKSHFQVQYTLAGHEPELSNYNFCNVFTQNKILAKTYTRPPAEVARVAQPTD